MAIRYEKKTETATRLSSALGKTGAAPQAGKSPNDIIETDAEKADELLRFRIDSELKREFVTMCKTQDKNPSAVLRTLIREWLK